MHGCIYLPIKGNQPRGYASKFPPAVHYAEKLPLGIIMGSKKFCQKDLKVGFRNSQNKI
jgi:hypothetical protein